MVCLQALILSERLHAIGSSFDQCRSVRYRQLKLQQMRQQQQRQRLNSVQVQVGGRLLFTLLLLSSLASCPCGLLVCIIAV